MSAIRHRLTYTASAVPLSQVIDALQAQQRLLPEAIFALSLTAPGSDLRLVQINVNEIESGSLIIDLMLQLYGYYQKNIDGTVVKGVEELLGADVPEKYEPLVTLFLFGVAYYVARWTYDTIRKKRNEPTGAPHITGDFNNVVTIIADRIEVSPDVVRAAIAAAVRPSKARQLVSSVASFFRPARSQPGSEIEGGGFVASPEALAEFPSDADLGDLDKVDIVNLPETLIDIRALDKDRGNRGWAAKIVGVEEYRDVRLPMDLYPTVDAQRLAVLSLVRADLALEVSRNDKGEVVPRRIHLLAYKEHTDDKPKGGKDSG